ncbi:hypothetical protein [uncultured Mediterranean phage uvMED]|nr:hypothetical protein [uncultured Mediterranean phage uvMED]
MYQINFKKFFDDEDLLTGKVMQLIELTQQNIDNKNNNQMEKKNDTKSIRNVAANS